MEHLVDYFSHLDPFWVYFAVTAVAYIENVFPPFPSDVIVVAAGSLAGLSTINFGLALLLATVGSTLGFVTMYKVGDWFGDKILETGRIRFIPIEGVHKVEAWFRKYGYWIIVANRFLAGTRAVVSFFAGMSEVSLGVSVVLSFFSALAWNSILLAAGMEVGQNWRVIAVYLELYGKTITVGLIIIAAAVGVQQYLKHRIREQNSQQSKDKKQETGP